MCGIIGSSQKVTYQAVNTTLVRRNWLLGYRIASEEMQGEERAKYGAEIIKNSLKNCRQSMEKDLQNLIYIVFIHSTRLTLRLLSWSHYVVLLQINDEKAHVWYEKEAAE